MKNAIRTHIPLEKLNKYINSLRPKSVFSFHVLSTYCFKFIEHLEICIGRNSSVTQLNTLSQLSVKRNVISSMCEIRNLKIYILKLENRTSA
jgi:hypothetical protein